MPDQPHSSNAQSGQSDAVAEAIADHRLVHGMVQGIRDTKDSAVLAAKLDDLLVFLERHFRLEEEPNGLYDAIFTNAPQLQRRGEALLREHRDISDGARSLLVALRSSVPPTDAFERAADLGRLILAHEANENQLHGEALYTELGVGD